MESVLNAKVCTWIPSTHTSLSKLEREDSKRKKKKRDEKMGMKSFFYFKPTWQFFPIRSRQFLEHTRESVSNKSKMLCPLLNSGNITAIPVILLNSDTSHPTLDHQGDLCTQ